MSRSWHVHVDEPVLHLAQSALIHEKTLDHTHNRPLPQTFTTLRAIRSKLQKLQHCTFYGHLAWGDPELYRLSKQKSKLLIQGLWWEHRLFHRAMRVVPITFKSRPVILSVKVPVFMFVLLFVWIKSWVCVPSLQKTARYTTYLLHDAKDTAFDISKKT